MKKILAVIVTLILIFSLTACGQSGSKNNSVSEKRDETITESTQTQKESETDSESESQIDGKDSTTDSKTLVAYFSLADEQYEVGVVKEGNTAIMAKLIAEELGADLFAIEPVEAYPTTYDGLLDIAKEEQRDNARPEIKNTVSNFSEYDTIFVGYPIWWGDMPNIVYSFLESYDFSGKTVIPFNTHAGSGQSGTQSTIEKMLDSSTVLEGLALRGKVAQEDREEARDSVRDWLGKLKLK